MALLRVTKQRQAVLEAVRRTDCHPDAAWVHAEVRKVLPRVSLGTVYRSLEALVEDGHLVAIHGAGESRRYDCRDDGHHHLICKRCGQIHDVALEALPQDTLSRVQLSGSQFPQGFRIEEVRLEFHGLCAECARAQHHS